MRQHRSSRAAVGVLVLFGAVSASAPPGTALAEPSSAALPWTADERLLGELTALGGEAKDGAGASFLDIASAGPDNACYVDTDHFVAEFLYQNPDVCFWEVDEEAGRVMALPTPTPPKDALRLPPPSGGDDTSALEAFINAHPGRALVGQGEYTVSGLTIRVPVDIFDMPMRAAPGAGVIVTVRSSDVRIFGSPIDGEGSSSATTGFAVMDGARRFTLVESGFSNVRHRRGRSVSGVYLREARDFHLACNRFENIINQTSDRTRGARANAVWMNGGSRTRASGGVIANNVAIDHQSNGARYDAEFLTIQSFASTDADRPLRVFGNRTVDAGKRFSKHQESDALVLSNEHRWDSEIGPLGKRRMLSTVTVHRSDDVIARNNRISIGARSRFDYVFITRTLGSSRKQDNLHFDCNDVELREPLSPGSNNTPHLFVARAHGNGRRDVEATNSSISHNRVHGNGTVNTHFWFGDGYRVEGGRFETIGNDISVPYLRSEYKP